jgi:hypothetical protein
MSAQREPWQRVPGRGRLRPVALSLVLILCASVFTSAARSEQDPPKIGAPPASLGLDPFYKKHIDLGGLPIVSSEKVPDAALVEAHRLASKMLERIPEVREAMVRNRTRVAIMAQSEVTTDIPEHSDLNRAFPNTDWNQRARGLGATKQRPAVSAAEENLLQYPTDRYRGESIFIHEFAHAIMDMGLASVHPDFLKELRGCFDQAIAEGLWKNTYAASNPSEYWAEGVQSYFDANRTADPPNGVHNNIGTREALEKYDPRLYELIRRFFPEDEWRWHPIPSSVHRTQRGDF